MPSNRRVSLCFGRQFSHTSATCSSTCPPSVRSIRLLSFHSSLSRLWQTSHEELAVLLTKESEKQLLIVLSLVFRQIQLWTNEHGCDSDNGTVAETPPCSSKCSSGVLSDSEDHDCLAKIIGALILLMSNESQYVQHLAGNILVAIADYMVAYGNSWDDYMQSLCICLKLAISNALLLSLEQPTSKQLLSSYDPSPAIIALERKLKNANLGLVACVIQVLRNILKHLKQDADDQFLDVYLVSISSCLANVPWGLIDELHVGPVGKAIRISSGDASHVKARRLESRILFLGALVQFFCSLAGQNFWTEADGGSSDTNPAICEISNLIPRLLVWCLGDGDRNICMTKYFRHKMLMLMIRLSFQSHLGYPLLVSWLQLIHVYFEDLLLIPMTNLEPVQDSLEGSPFLASVSDSSVQHMTSYHIQRLAVFLFLRCCFSLVGIKGGTIEQCSHANPRTYMTSDINFDCEFCIRKKGLSELYGWIKRHLPAEMSVGSEFYLEKCTRFSIAFLRLFVYEDDMLFKVLLQLISVPFCLKREACQVASNCQEIKDMLFHVSNLFHPVHLFHLFLAELCYDHQVLLDYLILKDTGASSAEYLLRSLRVVCDSWGEFVEFTLEGKVTNMKDVYNSSEKKRKVPSDGSDFQGHLTSSLVKRYGMESLGSQCQRGLMYGGKHHCRVPFENARNCLLSLKKSMQNLHQKNLFPYNPEVLLRRLTRFEELCLK